MECEAGSSNSPGRTTHVLASAFAPSFETTPPPGLGEEDETEPKKSMDEDAALERPDVALSRGGGGAGGGGPDPSVLSRSKAAKAEATQDRAPKKDRKSQAHNARRNASRDAARQAKAAATSANTKRKQVMAMDWMRSNFQEQNRTLQHDFTSTKPQPRMGARLEIDPF